MTHYMHAPATRTWQKHIQKHLVYDLGKMASSRKKQDEKHLKILRNLVSSLGNKQCFDCNQRGPTYVNVTIGSFVCTTCSGLLRGLTPPHRVKSISMTTFTSEEIESLQSKGNEYCRKVWLALYDSDSIHSTKDEHLVRDFMVAKYEKKLYYVEPSAVLKNGNSSITGQSVARTGLENLKIHQPVLNSSPAASPSINLRSIQGSTNAFISNATSLNLTDPFKATPNNIVLQRDQEQSQQEQSFANFDNNPIFASSSITMSSSLPSLKSNTTVEDKYAALKDLDCLMKMQHGSPSDQGSQGNGWSPSNLDIGSSLNPFQTDIGNNNFINPFRSGLTQQGEKNINNNGSCTNGGAVNSNSNCINPNNPWGGSSLWINNALPVNQPLAFSVPNWSGKGNLSIIPGSSNNPFL